MGTLPPLSRQTAQGISLLLKDVCHTITFLPWPKTVHLEGSSCGDLATSPLTITLGVTLLAGGDLLWTTGDGFGSAGTSCMYVAFQIEPTRIGIPTLSLKCTCKNQQIQIHLQIAHNLQYVFSRTELGISATKQVYRENVSICHVTHAISAPQVKFFEREVLSKRCVLHA